MNSDTWVKYLCQIDPQNISFMLKVKNLICSKKIAKLLCCMISPATMVDTLAATQGYYLEIKVS